MCNTGINNGIITWRNMPRCGLIGWRLGGFCGIRDNRPARSDPFVGPTLQLLQCVLVCLPFLPLLFIYLFFQFTPYSRSYFPSYYSSNTVLHRYSCPFIFIFPSSPIPSINPPLGHHSTTITTNNNHHHDSIWNFLPPKTQHQSRPFCGSRYYSRFKLLAWRNQSNRFLRFYGNSTSCY